MQLKLSLFVPALLAILLIACSGPPPAPGGEPAVEQVPPTEAATALAPAAEPTDPPAAAEAEEPAAEPTAEEGDASAADAPAEAPVAVEAVSYTDAWIINNTGATSPIFEGTLVDVESVTVETINGVEYQCITASGIPGYETLVTQALIDSLNERPLAARDFTSGETTLTLDEVVTFGAEIGYAAQMGCTAPDDGFGYWPPGPACPEAQAKMQCFPLNPEPTTEVCETGLGAIGTWINGVSVYNWGDGQSYNNQRVWQNVAPGFEVYDLDICLGHAANGDYHHHGVPTCLMAQLNDSGDGHSEIYGFAADGYPIYGPYQANGILAESCWIPRDYVDPNSASGCGVAGERSCLLVDPYDLSQGTTPASSNGPRTDETVTSLSGNTFIATSGYYLEDYYYDPACTAQGGEHLDQYNGHDHDGLGYHYHVTIEIQPDGSLVDDFPYYIGPTLAGALQPDGILTCGGGQMPGGGGPPPGGDDRGGSRGGGPDLSPVADALGIDLATLEAALGPPPPDFEAAAQTLGISVQALEEAFRAAGVGGPP